MVHLIHEDKFNSDKRSHDFWSDVHKVAAETQLCGKLEIQPTHVRLFGCGRFLYSECRLIDS